MTLIVPATQEFHLQLPIRYPNMPQLLLKARDSLLQHFRPILNHFGVATSAAARCTCRKRAPVC